MHCGAEWQFVVGVESKTKYMFDRRCPHLTEEMVLSTSSFSNGRKG